MKLTYYSYYPWKDPNKKCVQDEERGDLWAQPFRLYKAANCESLRDFDFEEDFVQACFEAMDRPEYRLDYCPGDVSYNDDGYGVKVIPLEHFYGATNTYDGVFVVETGKSFPRYNYYVRLERGVVKRTTWFEAVVVIFKFHHYEYATTLCDFTRK